MLLSRFKKFLHWEATPKPEISLTGQIYEELKPFSLPIILLVLIMLIGSMGYVVIDDMSLLDAIYQTGITFTTVGFGEIAPISDMGRIFTICLVIAGFGIMTFSIGLVVEVINKGNLITVIKENNMLYKIARLKNHFVICYHNEYTIELASQFNRNHVPFVVIDPHPEFSKEAERYNYPFYINDEPHKDVAIRKAYGSSAKGVIALSKNIADNIAQISTMRLFEKEISRKPYYIISSCEKDSDIEKLKKLGADTVVAPTKLLGQRISTMAIRPDMENMLENFLYQKEHGLDIEEIAIPKTSWIIFKKLKETHLREITGVSVIGIYEGDKFYTMPRGDKQIMLYSRLVVVGTSQTIKDAKRMIRKENKPEEVKYV